MASADREVLGHLVGDKTCDESAESMAAVFEAIEEWWEVEFFEEGADGVDGPDRKGLILVWL